jgi:DNA-binding CsgD family transcriptional regulator/tetratricopeptide (TPR) repeat protein
MPNDLEHSRACYDRGAWDEAFEGFRLADQNAPLACDDLQRLGIAAYLIGHELEFERYFDRLHRAQLEQGHREPAARSAFWLGLTLLFRGETAQSNAWIARGQRFVEKLDCVEHGYLMLPGIERILREGNAVEAQARAARATAIGERFGDAELIATARHVEGRALIDQRQIVAGLELLDETMLAVIGGELPPLTTALMYCSVLEACKKVYALGRAREWTSAFARWCERQSESLAFSSTCLGYRPEVRQSHGEWSAALEDVCRACDRAARGHRKPPGAALYQRGEIHRLRGEHPEAEEAYREASELGYEPQPGLALLRVAQGQVDAACAAMRRMLHTTTRPSKRARLLPSCIEVMLAADAIDEARDAWRELRELSDALDADALRAAAAEAEGTIDLAEARPDAALGPLRRAFEWWTQLDMPYDTARARALIGVACLALHDEETTRLELAAARTVFERLSARGDLARIDRACPEACPEGQRRSVNPLGKRAEMKLSPREREVLRLIAEGGTNKAIAARLSVSERTVDRHVSNILVKLAVPTRAAAIAFAYQHELL